MGICTSSNNNAKDVEDEIGRKIQEIMENNQKKIDYLEMKCNYLQMMLLNALQHIPYDGNMHNFKNFQNQYNIYHDQLVNKLNKNNYSNFKEEQ